MSTAPIVVISSDGHATARMEDYTDYLDSKYHEEFKDFCVKFREVGSYNSEERTLAIRLDPDVLEGWIERVIEPGRLDGRWNPELRIKQLDEDGVAGEVLIPDFGVPFQLCTPHLAVQLGYPTPDREHQDAANQAYNRWLADFMSIAPERFAGMASIEFGHADAVESTLKEIRWAKAEGFKGVMLPYFDEDLPLYDKVFEPIWSALEEYELVLCTHPSISGTSRRMGASITSLPHPSCAFGVLIGQTEFITHNVLDHLVWCGVLERHPNLKVTFTEQGSAWVPGKLAQMDYAYEGSYRRRDIREVVRHKPSEYFERQCYLGSSLLAAAEVEKRHEIGVDKMMIGVDYPHHEGTWELGSRNYFRATLGAVGVSEDEARVMLGTTAASVYSFDMAKLRPIADRIGPHPDEILQPPTEDLYPRGDVHKPASGTLA